MHERKRLGASEVFVSTMGVGTQAWGEKRFGYGKAYGRDDLFAAYSACLDAGVDFFDTSDTYAKGLSEEMLGEFRRRDGRPIVVATKFTQAKPYDPNTNFSPRSVSSVLDRSLQRLGLPHVDLYTLHYPPPRRTLDRYLDALAEAVTSGRARAIGVSNFHTERLRYAQDYLKRVHRIPLASNQVGYNLLSRNPESDGMLEACRELDVALIAILPLAEGVLTGRYRVGGADHSSVQSGLFRGAKLFEPNRSVFKALTSKPYEMQREALEPLFDVMTEVAARHGGTVAQVALNWLFKTDPRVIPIPGAKNVAQATGNVGALSWELSPEEFAHLSSTEAAIRQSLGR